MDQLKVLSKNARKHSDRNIEDIAQSLKNHGQQIPLIIDKDGVIRKGNGTYLAAKTLGWKTIEVRPYDAGFNRPKGEASAAQVKAFEIQDNRVAETSEWDLSNLQESLLWLRENGFDAQLLGWQPFELEPILQADFTPQQSGVDLDQAAGHKDVSASIELTKEQRAVFNETKKLIESREDRNLTDGDVVAILCLEFAK